ncbi:MAG TPA: PAS domain S-box protein, partial [Terracidiphilus sp.]|nr:PAS domain S-box protein [Terracidiphilus sp.]
MENTDDFIFFKDRNHVLTSASESVMDILGGDGKGFSALGQTDYDLFPEEYADLYYRLEKQVFSGIPVASEVQKILRPNGSQAWVDNHKYPIRNDKGEITGLFGIVRDVTERMKGEQALRAAEEKYRTIFDGALEGIFRAVIGDRILIANPAAARILGYDSPADLYDSIKDFMRDLWVDPAERAVFLRKLSESAGHAVLRYECRFKRRDRTPIWISLNCRLVVGDDGQEDYVEGFFTDITERKLAETALREREESLQEAQRIAGLGNYVLDVPGGTWTSSDVLDLLFGIDKEYERTVENWGALVHPDDRVAMVAYFGDEVVGKGKPFDREYRIVRPSDGAVRWMHGMGRLEFDPQGRPAKMHGTIQDITQQKRADEALRESKEILQLFIEHAPAGLAMFDRGMSYLAVSRRWLEMHSLLGEEVIGRSHYEIFPEIPELWREEHRRALAGEPVSAGEGLLKRANGTAQWVKREIIPWRTSDGAVGGIILFAEDVTRQKQTEQRLRLAASVFTNAREGIIITNPHGTILEVNEMFTRITGYAREEVLGQNPRLLKSGLQNE